MTIDTSNQLYNVLDIDYLCWFSFLYLVTNTNELTARRDLIVLSS